MSKHHNGCAIYDDGQCTCDALPYPRDTARSAVATPAYLQIDWLERRVKELEAEVETLRAAIDGEPWGGAVLKKQRDAARAEVARLNDYLQFKRDAIATEGRLRVAEQTELREARAEVERLREVLRGMRQHAVTFWPEWEQSIHCAQVDAAIAGEKKP